MITQQHDAMVEGERAKRLTLKRRGLIAGAAALAAGVLAQRASEPTAAATGGPLLIGAGSNSATNSQDTTAIINPSTAFIELMSVLFRAKNTSTVDVGVPGGLRVALAGTTSGGDVNANIHVGVYGGTESGYAVFGTCTNGQGVRGQVAGGVGVIGSASSAGSSGVVGTTNDTLVASSPAAGTIGLSDRSGVPGVFGHATVGDTNGVTGSGANGGAGVFGINSNAVGIGVQGFNDHGPAVQGNTSEGVGVNGISGTNGVGVRGMSATGFGVVGQTSGTGVVAGVSGTSTTAYGIIGSTTASGYSGLTAITSTSGVAALGATSTVANAYAAFFTGTTIVNGNFVATGGSKSAAVKDASGQHRLVYCVESPESWFEDFGKAKLVNGKADVTLDKTFGEIVHTDDYHVFLTEHGGHSGLHTTRIGAGGFTVEADAELAATKGKKAADLTGTFSYRVVAKRKDIVGERLAKFDMPKINHPDPDKLPKKP